MYNFSWQYRTNYDDNSTQYTSKLPALYCRQIYDIQLYDIPHFFDIFKYLGFDMTLLN